MRLHSAVPPPEGEAARGCRADRASESAPRRGRPLDVWTINVEARPGGDAPRAYQNLGRRLALALRAPRHGLRAIERAGRQIGRELAAPEAGDDGIDRLTTTLTALGFQPAVTDRSHDQVTICLRNCVYGEAARDNQPAICAPHKGISRGRLDIPGPEAKLTGFVFRGPDEASCEIEIKRPRLP